MSDTAAGAYASCLAALRSIGALVARVGPRRPVQIGGLSAAADMAMIASAANTPLFVAGVLLAATTLGWSSAESVDRFAVVAFAVTASNAIFLLAGPHTSGGYDHRTSAHGTRCGPFRHGDGLQRYRPAGRACHVCVTQGRDARGYAR